MPVNCAPVRLWLLMALAFAFTLAGCAAQPPPEAKKPEHAPVTDYGFAKLRTDGVYASRGIKGIGSAGGLLWPFLTPPTQTSSAEILKFNDDGTVLSYFGEEPISMEAVERYFAGEGPEETRPLAGMYVINAEGLSFVLKGRTSLGVRFSVIFHARIGTNSLIIEDRSFAGTPGPHEYFFEKLQKSKGENPKRS